MSDKAHSPSNLNPSRSFSRPQPARWRAVVAPLASFWAILLTVLAVFAMNGPRWLEELAARDQNEVRKADQEIMREVRQITAAETLPGAQTPNR